MSEYTNFIDEGLVKNFITHFLKVTNYREFINYINFSRYRNCINEHTQKYHRKTIENIMKNGN